MKLQQYIKAIEENNIVSKTDPNGIITYVNDEFCKISKYTRKQLIGKNHNIVRHPDVPSSTFKKLWDTIKQKKTYKSTVKNLARDGSVFYVNTTIIPIVDENDEIIEYIAIRYDVTKEVLLQQELEKKQKMIFWQSRFASLGQMIANIAHQWRQPLTELNFAIYNMKKSLLLNQSDLVNEYYDESKKLIQNMSQTIEDFTNFFKPNKQKKTFFIKDAIKDAISILSQVIIKEKIQISTKLNDIKMIGIPNELTQVIINLIQNSKDAFNQKHIKNKYIHIKLIKQNNYAIILFQDNAGGIDEEHQESIFEPYFTTKHSSSGIGLGLFMSKMICEQSLNGAISFENKDDGVEFKIKLPLEIKCEI